MVGCSLVCATQNNLAENYFKQGKYDKAEALFVECLAKRKEVLGDLHSDTLKSVNNLAEVYDKQGKYDEAIALRAKHYYQDIIIKRL